MTPRQAEFRKAYDEGLNDREVAQRMGLSRTRVRDIRNGLGLPAKPKPNPNPSMDREFLEREFQENMKRHVYSGDMEALAREIDRVAAEMGYKADSVRRVLRDMKLLPNMRRRYTEEQYKEGHRLLTEHGMPYTEAAKIAGVSRGALAAKYPGFGLANKDRWAYASAKELERKLGLGGM